MMRRKKNADKKIRIDFLRAKARIEVSALSDCVCFFYWHSFVFRTIAILREGIVVKLLFVQGTVK